MVAITNIRYRDIDKAEGAERERLANRLGQLAKMEDSRRHLTPDEADDKARIGAILDTIAADDSEVCNPLFVTVRDLFNASPGLLSGFLGNHVDGVLRGSLSKAGAGSFTQVASCKAALTLGLLSLDGAADLAPVVVVRPDASPPPPPPPASDVNSPKAAASTPGPEHRAIIARQSGTGWAQLSRMFFAAIGEAQSMQDLAMLVLPLLAQEGDPSRSDKLAPVVDAIEFAKVMRNLAAKGITSDEPQLRRLINDELDRLQGRGADNAAEILGIDLPDLEDAASAAIVKDNVRLMGPMICAAMFDELKAFEVVDKLVELFQHGMLTIGNGAAGKQLYKYWKDAPNRMSDAERRNFYAMTMGIPGGDSSGMVNREFNDLWLRFVSSVSSFVRQNEVDRLLRASLPSPISHQQIRKAARDLAVNLSLHGYGMAYYAALDLQQQIKFMINLLSDKEVMANYGARDMWQVIDQVATLELGGAKTSSRYATLASCGAIITAWLADNADRIQRPVGPIIDIEDVRSPMPRSNGIKATQHPTDYDLVNACELWLADTATGDSVIEQMAQPREAPAMTSRPVQIPSIAREMLADLPGVGLGYQQTRH